MANKLAQFLRPLLTPTGLTGGGTNLDGIVTAGLNTGLRAITIVGGNAYLHVLEGGTDAESSPTVIRPDDYAGTTNEKVWKQKTWL